MKKQKVILLLLLIVGLTKAQAVCVWTGAGDGSSFGDAMNWSCGKIPDMADEVVIMGATVVLSFTTTIKTLSLEGGTLSSVGGMEALMVTDGMLWTGGTIGVDITILPGAMMSMVMGGSKTLTKKLVIETMSTCTWDGGDFLIESGAELMIFGEFGVSFDGSIDHMGLTGGTVINGGIFKKVSGAGTLSVSVLFENAGTIGVESGRLLLEAGMPVNSGTIGVDTTSVLEVFGESLHAIGASYVGKGILVFSGMTRHLIESDFDGALALVFEADTVTMDGDWSTSGVVSLSRGELKGLGALSVSDTFDWSGGTITLDFFGTDSAIFMLSDTNSKVLSGTLIQDGITNWSEDTLMITATGSWENNGVFTVSSMNDLTGSGAFTNKGTFRKENTGTLNIGPGFSNEGIMAGIDTLSFLASFLNTGEVAPGLSPGILVKTGDYTNGSMLDIEMLNGSGPGMGHDQLIVTNLATLDGTLRVTETGMVPIGSYTILICEGTSPCLSGDFTSTDLPLGYSYALTATEVILTKSLILPVELVSFKARLIEGVVHLDWQTATELNNDHFLIERSLNGHSFQTIGAVEGRGTLFQPTNYHFTDSTRWTRPGSVYYRLKQVDYDGKTSESEIESVFVDKTNNQIEIDKIVNLDANRLEVFWSGSIQGESITLTLVNSAGQLLNRLEVPAESRSAIIDTSNQLNGIYWLTLSSAGQQTTESIFIK